MKTPLVRQNFNAGEIAPELQWRSDLSVYHNACLQLENFRLTTYGAASRRPGTKAIKSLGTDLDTVRLIPFIFNESTVYLVGVGYDDSTAFLKVWDVSGTEVASFSHSYPQATLKEIQFAQSYDVLFLAHQSAPLKRLARESTGLWTFTSHSFRGGPYRDSNTDTSKKLAFRASTFYKGKYATADNNNYTDFDLGSVSYSIGDVVAVGNLSSTDSQDDKVEINNFTALALWPDLSKGAREVEISDDGTTRRFRVYHVASISTATATDGDAYAQRDKLEEGSLIWLRDTTVDGNEGFHLVAYVEEGSSLGDEWFTFHTNYYQEIDAPSDGTRRDHVRVATTAAGTLASDFENGDTVDGVTLVTGDRILIKDQSTASENGIYVVAASGAPTRSTDADEDSEVVNGLYVYVEEGTANGEEVWELTTDDPIVVGTTSLTFEQYTAGGLVDDNLSSFTTTAPTGDAAILKPLDEDTEFYECVAAVSAGTVCLDDTTYWKRVWQYEESLLSYCQDYSTEVFDEDTITNGDLMSAVLEAGAEVSGKFKASGSTIKYTDGMGTQEPDQSTSREFLVWGTVNLEVVSDNGDWKGRVALEISEDNGDNWISLATVYNLGKRGSNIEIEREIERSRTLARINAIDLDSSATDDNFRFHVSINGDMFFEFTPTEEFLENGVAAWITPSAPVTEVPDTYQWAYSAFSETNGYPRAVALHEERLMLAGTPTDVNTVWGSAINDWEEFALGTLATSPVRFQLASDTYSAIQWILSKQNLIVGTTSGEWTLGSRSSEEPLSALTVSARRHSEYGSKAIQGILTTDVAAFVERGGLRLRGFIYSLEQDSYIAQDLTYLSRHLNQGGFEEIAYMRNPDSILWALAGDGTLAALTIEREQKIAGWGRHKVGDEVVSLCTTPGGTTSDYLWFCVKRGSDYYIELLDFSTDAYLDWLKTETHATRVSAIALIDAPPESGYSLFANGMELVEDTHYTISDDDITIDADYDFTRVDVGYKYTSLLETTPIGARPQGDKVRVSAVDLYLIDAFGGEISLDEGDSWESLVLGTTAQFGYVGDGGAVGVTLFNGKYESRVGSGFRDDLRVQIRTDAQASFTLCAVGIEAKGYK